MAKKNLLKPEDRDLFRRTVGSVKPVRNDRVEPGRHGPAPIPRATLADEQQVLHDMVSDYFEPADMDTGEEILYRRDGLQQSILRKLRRPRCKYEKIPAACCRI